MSSGQRVIGERIQGLTTKQLNVRYIIRKEEKRLRNLRELSIS